MSKWVNIVLFSLALILIGLGSATYFHQRHHKPKPIVKSYWVGKNPRLVEKCDVQSITITADDFKETTKKATTTWVAKYYGQSNVELWFEVPDSKPMMYFQLSVPDPPGFCHISTEVKDDKVILTWVHPSHLGAIIFPLMLGFSALLALILIDILENGFPWKRNKSRGDKTHVDDDFRPSVESLPIIPE